jgi:hypothetical protein
MPEKESELTPERELAIEEVSLFLADTFDDPSWTPEEAWTAYSRLAAQCDASRVALEEEWPELGYDDGASWVASG